MLQGQKVQVACKAGPQLCLVGLWACTSSLSLSVSSSPISLPTHKHTQARRHQALRSDLYLRKHSLSQPKPALQDSKSVFPPADHLFLIVSLLTRAPLNVHIFHSKTQQLQRLVLFPILKSFNSSPPTGGKKARKFVPLTHFFFAASADQGDWNYGWNYKHLTSCINFSHPSSCGSHEIQSH